MNEENRKEILTRDIIKKDVKSILIYNVFMMLFYSALFWFFAFLIYSICMMGSPEDVSLLKADLIFIVTFMVLSIPFFVESIYCIILLVAFKRNSFNITTDKVYDKKVNKWLARKGSAEPQKPILSFGVFKTGLTLCFEKHKKYAIATGGHYGFSSVNKMQYTQQFGSTDIGNEFYLAKVDDRIIEIYNTKFFELQQ